MNDQIDPLAPTIESPKQSSFWRELVTFLIIAVVIVLPFRWYVAEPYIVSGTSMYPTFNTGHYLVVDKVSYRFHAPQREDVVVMIYPKDVTEDFIKRIIGLPGEEVIIKNGVVSIIKTDGTKITLSEPYVVYPKTDDTMDVKLTNDQYFVMGDNRAGSFDSRYWGPLPASDIIGKPILRLLPISNIGFDPGAFSTSIASTTK